MRVETFPLRATHRELHPGPPSDGKAGLYTRHFSDLRDILGTDGHLDSKNKTTKIIKSIKRKKYG